LEQAFEIAELAHLSENERAAYEHSLKIYRDNINILNSTAEKAKAEGKAEGFIEGELNRAKKTALQMLADGEPISKISLYTGLSEAEIAHLSIGGL